MEERECDGDRAEKSRAGVKVQYALGKYGTEEEGKMCIDIFTFQKNALACVRAHQGVVTFCFHNLHRYRGRRWGDGL